MFIKLTRSGGRSYAQLVESFRDEQGRPRQRTLATLGRSDEVGGQVDALLQGLLRVKGRPASLASPPQVQFESALALGDVWALHQLWHELGFDRLHAVFRRARYTAPVEQAIRVMVFNRLCDADSKLGALRWLQTVALPDVQTDAITHQHLLRSMDALMDHQASVDDCVAQLLRPLIDEQLSVVFYDLTTIRAEGLSQQGGDVRKFGMSKEGIVARQFLLGVVQTEPIITAVTIDIAGTFNMSPTGEQWKPFTSRQRVVTRRPGFLWDAKIAMLPGVTVRVVDSYIAGKGLLRATVLGLFTMAEQQGDGDIARGEFMRWFAEVLWYPTALLPSQGVRWEAVDDQAANATLVDGPLSLTLLFRFNDAGLIAWFRAEARGGMVGDKMVMAPWEGIWSNYQTRDGVQVPFTGAVAWMRPEGRKPYFIGTVTALAFEFSP